MANFNQTPSGQTSILLSQASMAYGASDGTNEYFRPTWDAISNDTIPLIHGSVVLRRYSRPLDGRKIPLQIPESE